MDAKKKKNLLFAGAILYFLVGYFATNWFNSWRGISHLVAFSFEEGIPFYPLAIIGYSFVFISLLIVYFMVPAGPLFDKTAKAFFLLMTLHYIIFILFPVRMDWRPFIEPDSFLNGLTWLYYSIDQPYNCFPSLHVAFPTLSAAILWNRPRLRWLMFLFALIVAISVVLVKQHYILDAAAGALIALTVTWLVFFRKAG